MLNNFNPFSEEKEKETGVLETKHGLINYDHGMGTIYITHRHKEHFFRKFSGFGISLSELEIAYEKRVHWILIMYHKEDGTSKPYRIKLNDVKYLEEYNNNGDKQRIFRLMNMETPKNGNWE